MSTRIFGLIPQGNMRIKFNLQRCQGNRKIDTYDSSEFAAATKETLK
jgi:hypothetical protein